MTIKKACNRKLPFGKYRGQTIAQVGRNARGLLYLDWLLGLENLDPELKSALKTYLSHEDNAKLLAEALGDRDAR